MDDDKRARLAAALRANLRRRKAVAPDASSAEAEPEPPGDQRQGSIAAP